ncbi:MAG: hypothetical protein AMXMBFR34_49020 [Myxococcaceae bacterium]
MFAARNRSPVTDPAAFAQLYSENFARVWRVLRRLGVGEASLDDASHDVFVIAWRRGPEFAGRSSVQTWLLGIAIRVASDARRGQLRRMEPLPDSLVAPENPEAEAHQREASALVHRLLEQLRPDRREIFVLMELEQYTAPEVAEALSINLNTVYTRLRAARQDFNALVKAVEEQRND